MKRKITQEEPKVEDRQVAILKDGKDSPFWNTLKTILNAEKEGINNDILAKEDLGLSDKAVSDLIKWHNFLDYVVKLPEKCIESLETKPVNDGTDEESNDPYESPLEQVRKKIEHY